MNLIAITHYITFAQDPLVDWAGAGRAKEQGDKGIRAGEEEEEGAAAGTAEAAWEPLRKVGDEKGWGGRRGRMMGLMGVLTDFHALPFL